MVVGLIGAFLTAAYMTRCVCLTFFGEYRGPRPPARVAAARSRSRSICSPSSSVVRRLRCNAAPLRASRSSASGSSPRSVVPRARPPRLRLSRSPRSRRARRGRASARRRSSGSTARSSRALKGLTAAQRARARRATRFLVNKYYLDDLYEGVIVAGIKGPIARGVVLVQPARHRRGRERRRPRARRGGRQFVYDGRRPGVVDGAVNGLAGETGDAGGVLRKMQIGQVQQYALVLFARGRARQRSPSASSV